MRHPNTCIFNSISVFISTHFYTFSVEMIPFHHQPSTMQVPDVIVIDESMHEGVVIDIYSTVPITCPSLDTCSMHFSIETDDWLFVHPSDQASRCSMQMLSVDPWGTGDITVFVSLIPKYVCVHK